MGEYFWMGGTSNPMRTKLTMLFRLPHGPILIAGLLAYSPFAWSHRSLTQLTTCASPATTCTIPAAGSGHSIVVGRSSTFGSTPSIPSITADVANTYFEAANARSVNSSRSTGNIHELAAVVIESLFSLVLERY
jgi:hypothetical protein